MSQIQNFGDALTSYYGDAAFPGGNAVSVVGDVHISRRWYISSGRWPHLPDVGAASPAEDAASPQGDVDASPQFWICDTTRFVAEVLKKNDVGSDERPVVATSLYCNNWLRPAGVCWHEKCFYIYDIIQTFVNLLANSESRKSVERPPEGTV